MAARSNQFPKQSKIIIVGGGVIGLSIARALALRGVRDVTVIEKGEFGREASWAAGGILAPQVEADAADDFLVENRRLVEALLLSSRNLGVRLIDHCEVSEVQVKDGAVLGVETPYGFVNSDSVAIAAGAWSSSIDTTQKIEIEPVRGEM